jgi:hypothetical protein
VVVGDAGAGGEDAVVEGHAAEGSLDVHYLLGISYKVATYYIAPRIFMYDSLFGHSLLDGPAH